jgi:hypothetical protein
VRRLIKSPRRRRRALWLAAVLAAIGVTIGVIELIPSSSPRSPAPVANEGPAQVVVQPVYVRLTATDRKAIDSLLDRFVPAAVERRSASEAWALAGPELKAGSTLSQWKTGDSPVPYYPATGKNFHGWQPLEVTRGYVTFSLLVHPRPGVKLGAYVFSGVAIRQHRRWLVNRFYTTAIMNPVRGSTHEVGPADFGAPGAAAIVPSKPALGRSWILPVVAVLSLAVLAPLGLGVAVFVRSRRRKRRQVAEGRTELPPLPSAFRSE